MQHIRRPAVAGMFYPGEPEDLAAQVRDHLRCAKPSQHALPIPDAPPVTMATFSLSPNQSMIALPNTFIVRIGTNNNIHIPKIQMLYGIPSECCTCGCAIGQWMYFDDITNRDEAYAGRPAA